VCKSRGLVVIIFVIGHYVRRTVSPELRPQGSGLAPLQQFPLQIDDLADVVVGVGGAAEEHRETVVRFRFVFGLVRLGPIVA